MNQSGRMEKTRAALDPFASPDERIAALAEVEETETRLAYFIDGGQTITVGRQWLKDLEYRAEAAEADAKENRSYWQAERAERKAVEAEADRLKAALRYISANTNDARIRISAEAALAPADRNTT